MYKNSEKKQKHTSDPRGNRMEGANGSTAEYCGPGASIDLMNQKKLLF
jgi:hypothetical protein